MPSEREGRGENCLCLHSVFRAAETDLRGRQGRSSERGNPSRAGVHQPQWRGRLLKFMVLAGIWFCLLHGRHMQQLKPGGVAGVGEKDTSKAAEEVRLSWVQPSRPSKPCSAPGSRGLESRHWGFGWPSRARSSCIMPGCARPNLQMEDRPWGAGLQVLSASSPGRPGHPTLCSPLSQGTSPGWQWSPFRPGGPWLRRLLWLDSLLWG